MPKTSRVTATEIKKEILNCVKRGRNLTPSEIISIMQDHFPAHSHYEVRFLIKEMQKDHSLIHDIIYGGLKAA